MLNKTGAHLFLTRDRFELSVMLNNITPRDIDAFYTETPQVKLLVGENLNGCHFLVLADKDDIPDNVEPLIALGELEGTTSNFNVNTLKSIDEDKDLKIKLNLFEFHPKKLVATKQALLPSDAVKKIKDLAIEHIKSCNKSHLRRHESFSLAMEIPDSLLKMREPTKPNEFHFHLKICE